MAAIQFPGFPLTWKTWKMKKISRPGKVLGKKKKMKMSWKFFRNTYEIIIEYFSLRDQWSKRPQQYFLPQITFLENLNFDLKSLGERQIKSCENHR